MKTLLLALLLVLPPRAGAMQANTGTTAADFLSLGAGARALGMGEAYSAVTDGPDAAYWNPAGLAWMSRPQVSYARSELPAGLHGDFLAVGAPSRLLRGTVAFAVTRFSQENLDLVNNANQNVGTFAPHSEAYALAYGHRFSDDDPLTRTHDYFSEGWNILDAHRPVDQEREPWTGVIAAGLSLKVVSENLGTRSAAAFAMDGGGMFRPVDLPEFILAGAFRNIGGKIHFISDSEPLPAELALAAAYEVRRGDKWRWTPALEVDGPYAGSPYGKLGCEAAHLVGQNLWALVRLGYSSRSVPDLGPLSGVTGGVGLRISAFSFDAAFQPMAILGESFRLGVGWRF